MKKLNLIQTGIVMSLLLISCFSLKAQSPLTFTQAMDSILAPLDKSRITTGILYERVKPLANIDLFNETSSEPFVSEYSLFRQAYFEIYNAAYNKTNWLKPEWFRAKVDGEVYENRFNIGILDYQFNMLDSNALNNGKLSFSNGQFHDVPGSASPYYTKRLQMVSILADEIPGGVVILRFNPDFIKTNQTVQVSTITLNFGTTGTYFECCKPISTD